MPNPARVLVRAERPGDETAIHDVHASAFPTPDEAQLVDQLRSAGDVAVSLVATVNEAVVGHVLYSELVITRGDERLPGVALAPVAVLEELRRRGIAGRLIRAGLEEARDHGYGVVIVLGDPAYYGRFGFSTATARAYVSAYSGIDAYQVLELGEIPTENAEWQVAYPAAFGDLD